MAIIGYCMGRLDLEDDEWDSIPGAIQEKLVHYFKGLDEVKECIPFKSKD